MVGPWLEAAKRGPLLTCWAHGNGHWFTLRPGWEHLKHLRGAGVGEDGDILSGNSALSSVMSLQAMKFTLFGFWRRGHGRLSSIHFIFCLVRWECWFKLSFIYTKIPWPRLWWALACRGWVQGCQGLFAQRQCYWSVCPNSQSYIN